jgi:signal transduction histidine kinase/CheY-like chemotaxis protein
VEAKQSYSLWNYFADNPSVMSALVIIVLLILVSFLLIQRKNSEKLEESNNALNASRDALEDALEAANEANASKTKFLSQMSHDIRTPLNGIIGMTRIAGDHADDPERVTDALDKISQSSDHLLTLINDILDLSRIESGKMSMAHEPTDLPATINQCVEVLKSSVIDRDIRVISDIAPVDYPVVLTDALHVRQVLINIISNAVKFTPDGGKIIFRFQAHPDADHRVLQSHFEIADTGIGMSEDFQDHIFEAFVQADDSDARTQYKGSGLGMAIVKEFVEMLGGQIEIRSRMNAGTTICLDFPFEIDGDASALKKKEAVEEDAGGYEFADVRVLLVEDNNINMEIAEVMLESRGIIVETALNGQEAVERFNASEAGHFQCILMDIMMPVMNGYEAARAIRALERTDARTIPIIAMTANAFAEDVQAALDSGMNGHIAKPIEMDVLTGTIHDCIQREKED